MMKRFLAIAPIVLMPIFAEAADLRCFSNIPCSIEMMDGIVSSNFHKLFPSNKWEILVVSGNGYYQTNGGSEKMSIAWATVSLSPTGSRKLSTGTRINVQGVITNPTQSQLDGHELLRVRQALSKYAKQCEQQPKACYDK
jgi:hypothetical protein